MSGLNIVTSSLELQRSTCQIELDGERSQLERNQLGQFATPPSLAQEIVAAVLQRVPQNEPVSFLEPSVGSGSFFSALIDQLGSRSLSRAVGIEIDGRFATLAKQLWASSGLEVLNEDFLLAAPQLGNFNLLIANPPYVRHHHIDAAKKKILHALISNNLSISTSGLSGLYCYFMLLADSWLADDAISAWLVPSEFMDVNYGKSVRTYLTKKVSLLQIHRYCPTEDKFDDALVSSAVVIFQNRKPATPCETLFSFGGSINQPRIQNSISLDQLKQESRWTRLACRDTNADIRRSAKSDGRTLTVGELFDVKRGVATGANSFFMLKRAEAQQMRLPDETLRPILPSPRFLKSEIIERDRDGYPEIDRQVCLLDCRYSEKEVERDHPALWDYLQRGVALGIPGRYLTSRRIPWYSQELRDPAPYLCSYMGRSEVRPFRFFWNKSDAIAANVFLMLYPKPFLAAELLDSKTLATELFQMFSEVRPEDFFDEGRVYGGGLFKMEPAELKRLRVKGMSFKLNRWNQKSFW